MDAGRDLEQLEQYYRAQQSISGGAMVPSYGPQPTSSVPPPTVSSDPGTSGLAAERPVDSGPAGYRRPDHLILDDFVKAIAWDPLVPSTGLNVECEEGVLRVSGTVPEPCVADRVRDLLAGILGIRDVQLDLPVDLRWHVDWPDDVETGALQDNSVGEGDENAKRT